MNPCELNKFIDRAWAQDIAIDCYNFNPMTEEATISKGSQSVVIDLNASTEDQLSEFQLFLDRLIDAD